MKWSRLVLERELRWPMEKTRQKKFKTKEREERLKNKETKADKLEIKGKRLKCPSHKCHLWSRP